MSIPNTKHIPIEDDPCDVISKAMRGMGLNESYLAEQAGLTTSEVQQAVNGNHTAAVLEKLATALNLSPQALSGLESYRPSPIAVEGLVQIVSDFGHAGVNAFVVSRGKQAVVFDTGTNAQPILDYLASQQLKAAALVITHRHSDHTAGLDSFADTPVIFPEDTEHQQEFECGGMHFTALDVSGHAQPARAYFHQELSSPLCVVGDSIFAGSIGGARSQSSYSQALKTIHDHIRPLPEETVICPGHGPMTTLAQETKHNPFIANM
ncbi:MBL fold metallo-hydrolase [Verrucomicrobiaceae bacterium 5K15]|uniref:MBL fold metallo-hydrolase n=1 Tax=Oceaniferula flava TaxID=2800421 RepID=A0AAE2VBL2_9BACT|nr:MBL fold metallo-hydrolase [Oceaniferula flavus]MBK1854655.1 MBL fold metallo-hydrolase [Oceaniferula flavus]MBM1135961.1 MBL fold metallo-hydrolase [Oceaniferula flavus]